MHSMPTLRHPDTTKQETRFHQFRLIHATDLVYVVQNNFTEIQSLYRVVQTEGKLFHLHVSKWTLR